MLESAVLSALHGSQRNRALPVVDQQRYIYLVLEVVGIQNTLAHRRGPSGLCRGQEGLHLDGSCASSYWKLVADFATDQVHLDYALNFAVDIANGISYSKEHLVFWGLLPCPLHHLSFRQSPACAQRHTYCFVTIV